MFGLNSQPHLLFLLIVLGFLSYSVQSLRFELQSGHGKCMTEDIIKTNSMNVGNYNITNPHQDQPLPDSHAVTVMVTSSDGKIIYHRGEHVQSGHFAFEAVHAGKYVACFWATDHNPQITLTIDFDWRTSVAAKDWSKIAKRSHVELMTLELQNLHEVVSSIHDEMFYLRKQGEEMEVHLWTTNIGMFWLSFLSLFVCMSVAGLELWHLKTFFEKKKIL